MKRIAGTFRHNLTWDDMVEDVLLDILLIKFSSDSHCKEVLLETGDCSNRGESMGLWATVSKDS